MAPVESDREFKRGFALGFVVVCGSGLLLFSVMTRSASEPTTEAMDLMGLAPSVGAPAVMRPSMLPGSGPFKRLALAAIEANNLARQGRDVSVMAANLKGVMSTMNDATKNFMVRAEEAAKLKAKDLAGITAPLGFFDPLGFSADCEPGRLLFFREVEIKHGRVGMLASLGFLVGENFHPLFGGNIDVPSYIAFQQTPLQQFWVIVSTVMFVPELASINSFQKQESPDDGIFMIKTDRVPGDFGFDPLNLKPKDPKAFLEMQNKEINNGRLAMLAAAGMIAQELATGKKLFG